MGWQAKLGIFMEPQENVLFFPHLPFNGLALETPTTPGNTLPSMAALRSRTAYVMVAAVGWLAGWAVWACDLHTPWEDRMYFHLMEMRPAPAARDTGLVQIKVQDMTDEPWPWPHLDYAILLHALTPYQPEVLALDLPLDVADTLQPVYERQLARQMKAFRDVVLSAKPSPQMKPTPAPPGLDPLPSDGFTGKLAEIGSVRWPIEAYWSNCRISPTGVAGSASGRVPLVFRMADTVVPSFPLVIYGKSIGAYWPHCELVSGSSIILRDYQKKVMARIPVDAQGCLRLQPAKRIPPPVEVEFYTVVLSAEQKHQETRPLFDLDRLRRQVVLVSLEHPDTASQTPTPEGSAYPGTLTGRVLQQLFLREYWGPVPPLLSVLLFMVCAIIATWAGSLPEILHGLAALAGGFLFLAVDAWFGLHFLDLTLPVGSMATSVLAAWSLAIAWTAFSAEKAPDQASSPQSSTP